MRDALGASVFESAVAEGNRLTKEEALAALREWLTARR
jgi:hypothetical protein